MGIIAKLWCSRCAPVAHTFAIFRLVLLTIATFLCEIMLHKSRVGDMIPKNMAESYDFIVVGGGSAGAVIASRLSEIPEWSVLLIEAGGEEPQSTDMPMMTHYNQLTDLDWQYKTEPTNAACLAMTNHQCNWPRGKVIGGSSVLNYMVYVRGNSRDYDHWEAMGNPGWGYQEVLRFFKKSEDNTNLQLMKTPFHAAGGYLTVADQRYGTKLGKAFLQAGVHMGYRTLDTNGEFQTGFNKAQATIRLGSRCSTAKAFLRPVKFRANLHISLNSQVNRILIDPKSKKAYGVQFYWENRLHTVRAKKEVILSAGAINSPQLLMLSGVGPKAELHKHGIPIIQDLKGVGRNLQDHFGVLLTFIVNKPYGVNKWRAASLKSLFEFIVLGLGPLTLAGGIENIGFVNTKFANESGHFPDIEILFIPGSTNNDDQLSKIHGLSTNFYHATYDRVLDKDSFSLVPFLLRPKSRGYIKLKSSDPFAYPVIQPNYFLDANKEDIKTAIEGAKIVMALAATPPLLRYKSTLVHFPYCKHTKEYSDAFYECMIRHYTFNIYHYSGTAKMGPVSDPMAVVDSQLKVYGIGNLRVVDASIMPEVVSGNTNAPVIMIGEKGSDMIKTTWMVSKG